MRPDDGPTTRRRQAPGREVLHGDETARRSDQLPGNDDRPVDPDAESLLEQDRPTALPEEERAVPGDPNKHVRDEPEVEA